MSLIFRLASTQLHRQLLTPRSTGIISVVKPVKFAHQCASDTESHDEKNMRLGRPQSPHLTIYSFQLTSALSISHRMTGMMLSGYTVLFAFAAVALPESIPHYIEALECACVGGAGIAVLKAILAFPFSYHFWNGVRHLFWDAGLFLTMKEVYLTGYTMLGLTCLTTGALCLM